MSGHNGSIEEVTITMTDQLALPGRVMCSQMQISADRARRIMEIRAKVDELGEKLAEAKAALAVEEADLARESRLIDQLMEQWNKMLDVEFAKAAAPAVSAVTQHEP